MQVKIIALITGIIAVWGVAPQLSCIKDKSISMLAAQPADTFTSPVQTDTMSYLALGDSYTIGESVPTTDRYPVQAAQLLRADHVQVLDPEIIATTGWTTADLLNALAHYSAPRPHTIVTLLIGVNNQYQGRSLTEYKTQFTSLLRQSIALAGDNAAHVIILSIPDYSVTPFARGRNTTYIAAQIDSFNTINRQVALDYKVQYIDITGESRKAAGDPSLIAIDGLHFSGKEYAIWASMLEAVMKKIKI